jgi:peptide/nickel transport system ATP-binding protein
MQQEIKMSIDAIFKSDEMQASPEWRALLDAEGSLLKISSLRAEYRTEKAKVYALNGMDLVIQKGQSIGLVGETGAGKTTAALSVLNILPKGIGFITGGNVEFSGRNVQSMSQSELRDMRGGKISMIFQNPLTALNPVFSVGEQIAMVLREHQKLNHRQGLKRAGELLQTVGSPNYRVKDYPMQFSGGMRQRVGIAAALACNPMLLIADEPTTALDVTIQAQILELMRRLQEQYTTSLLMITHNLGIIAELCQHVAVMYAGRIIEYGSAQSVFSSPKHPYTIGLIGALPKLKGPKKRLTAIPGTIADPRNLPPGCAFHPRCEHCKGKCKDVQPLMNHVGGGHFVECFSYE